METTEIKVAISHYKVNGIIFLLYDDAFDYCYENKISIDLIKKTKEY